MRGFNVNIDFCMGHEQCPSGPLFPESEIRDQVVAMLKGFPVNEKVLRFPGGTMSRTWNGATLDVAASAQFVRDIEGEDIAFVAKVADLQQSFNVAKAYKAAGLNIGLFEFGNEEYDHNQPQGKTEQWRHNMNPRGHYHERGKQYGIKYNQFKAMVEREFPNTPVAASVQLRNSAKNDGWYTGLRKTCNPDALAHHFYHHPETADYEGQVNKHWSKFEGKDVYETEVNIKYQPGNYQWMAYGDGHQTILTEMIDFYENKPNVKGVFVHSLWGNYLFARFVKEGIIAVDKYKGWYDAN